ncbi:RNA polymerase sigma factor [Alkalilimnicola ehrlichii MLHE-1]|uniref:RNA polymerase, sigma-24 subunit, RpoE n=1 Tax=Alkalilimnicola ehrlichii (strain ATCC BAA-1101 / DSM 17681 / MLHE-1) TaxID=187272 RepID=Q0A857_ALKEH|nr:sigma-70 family RNA polymerase sigma factor [Alkalilimnicola ehrlichii]ABI56980.1 RNA polymerase, sigma-24 subunit, RpoE [Alkalilimnicola ehrlichii MLHE-1]
MCSERVHDTRCSGPEASAPGGRAAVVSTRRRALFEREIGRLMDRLYGAALRLTRDPDEAEEVVAETVARAWARLDQLRDPECLAGWLFHVLGNVFVSRCRQRRRRDRTELSVDAEVDGESAADDSFSLFQRLHQPFLLWWGHQGDQFLSALMREDLARALDGLPEDYRLVVILVEVQGYRYREVAELLDIPVGTVQSRLSRGRARLQKALWQHALDAGLVNGREPGAGD